MSARRSFRLLSKTRPATATLPMASGVVQAVGALQVLDALPHPILTIAEDGLIESANPAAEAFFGTSLSPTRQQTLEGLLPIGSSLLTLIEQVREDGGAINEYRVDLGLPRLGVERLVDIFVAPVMPQSKTMVVMLRERTIAEKLDRQHAQRGAARSVSAMASMLAHEIKNPLSGIRGAAQLLETEASDGDRALTRLICDETDRIVKLVDRMKPFSAISDEDFESVNIHVVLDHVKKVAQAGFARHIRFTEIYDPSLPPVFGSRDQLVQVFLNLVKNAAEAIGSERIDGEIELRTAFRPGVRLKINGSDMPVSLPLEFCVRDNGPGVPEDLLPRLFDPFVTTKPTGTGLGLALIAKIVGDHGGIVECESHASRTTFKVLMPMHVPKDGRAAEASD
ncbi:Sensory histidine kinase/phosphatase NtrB [Beijerinckiaceae bacterium RH AL1]|nr:Sensory histidine kinase/phosphatase NtrB [Beijerinckiaceae bacterium RH CH11]VVB45544.1 Sensory histidine kinase/phosphatase NtrB [Beijerinckiaceae bacterium RH AL8]VVC54880.1 Sensory histidine kinase/phosphatase NtrB [Beijerinckiaceae bacterium RH AL1]